MNVAPGARQVPFRWTSPPGNLEVGDPVGAPVRAAEDDSDHVVVRSNERLGFVDIVEVCLARFFSTLASPGASYQRVQDREEGS